MSWLKNNIAVVIWLLLFIVSSYGWVLCVIKLTRTDFEKPYKAEILYGVGTLTGTGAIIGWLDIKD